MKTFLKHAYLSLLFSVLVLTGCVRCQVKYEKPSAATRWAFAYTGN